MVAPVIFRHSRYAVVTTIAFEEAVDDYLEACAAISKTPEKTVSGKLLLRFSPDIHATVQIKARSLGQP